ncbi:MAG: conjugal transfer protein TraI [Hymenobacteraceae bacterium]|nr:conjugal transfer protein TraI [Hymenobacteraceae bacterium]MDX5481967.1 conjugal transfer protein TraI [Hymenobacteraceae bacterium]
MQKLLKLLVLGGVGILLPLPGVLAQDPITEVIKAGVTKVIKAMDLRIQRQQNEVIWLQNAQKALENKMSELQLGEIRDWVDRQRSLYQEYYEELYQVKNTVADYQRLRGIARRQALLLEEYERAWRLLRQDEHFRPEERQYMARVYAGILEQSAQNMELVLLAVRAHATQMGDAGRMGMIREAAEQVDAAYNDLVLFNRQNFLLRLQRARTQQDVEAIRDLYGLPGSE